MEKIRVLLADDHAMVRAGVRQFLELSDQMEVVAEVDNGEAVKIALVEFNPHIVILDIKMPQLNGIETTRWIRQQEIDVGVIILSTFDDEAFIKAVLRAGADGYMLKSASPQALEKAVIDVNNGLSALDPTITHKLLNIAASHNQPSNHEALTPRELETLSLAAIGKTNKEIGVLLDISSRTVQSHLANINQKLDVANRTEAINKANRLGLLKAEL